MQFPHLPGVPRPSSPQLSPAGLVKGSKLPLAALIRAPHITGTGSHRHMGSCICLDPATPAPPKPRSSKQGGRTALLAFQRLALAELQRLLPAAWLMERLFLSPSHPPLQDHAGPGCPHRTWSAKSASEAGLAPLPLAQASRPWPLRRKGLQGHPQTCPLPWGSSADARERCSTSGFRRRPEWRPALTLPETAALGSCSLPSPSTRDLSLPRAPGHGLPSLN